MLILFFCSDHYNLTTPIVILYAYSVCLFFGCTFYGNLRIYSLMPFWDNYQFKSLGVDLNEYLNNPALLCLLSFSNIINEWSNFLVSFHLNVVAYIMRKFYWDTLISVWYCCYGNYCFCVFKDVKLENKNIIGNIIFHILDCFNFF